MQGLLLAGRYRLVDPIGSGGMGRVWRARDEVLHRSVAIKELTAALYVTDSDRAVLLARTQTEARAAARINHSAVVTVHDVLEHDNRPWIVMELVEGGSLADAVRDRERLEPAEAARIGLWVLRALGAAHAAGVVHRDVKPGNVLLATDGRVLLTDFGIAQVEGDTTITRTGEIVGSVDYLAPERVRGQDPGPASDLWALGATLYTAVEGRSPFRRTSPLTTMQAVVDEEPPAPHYAGPALGPVIEAFLRKDPATRPSAAEAEQMLAEAAEGRRPRAAQAYVPTRHVDMGGAGAAEGDVPDGPGGGGAADGQRTAVTPGGFPDASGATHVSAANDVATAVTDSSGGVAAGQFANPAAGHASAAAGHTATPVPGRATVGTHIPGAPGGTAHPATPPFGATAHPATPPFGATAHQPQSAPPGAGGRPGRRGRTIALVLAFAVVVGAGGALAWNYVGNGGTDGHRTDTSATDAATASPSGSGSPSASASSGADGAASGAVPDGWQRVDDPLGFSIVVPDGWKRQVEGTQIDYTPDGGEHFLRVAIDDSPDFDTAYAHQVDLEQQLKRLVDYKRVSLVANTYRDCQGALWDFTWTALAKDGPFPGPRRAIEQAYISRDGVEYVLYFSSPAGDWDTARQQFDKVLRGWRPPARG
ncbi:serine/threonine-protein kinase [Streptomyces sp. NBC_00670]|jgi:tRNA A-37 threonylcarbamoyl transferase component Bud32|uniref:serine/threonine-protein kinase n=1 Tax=Streptomyces sp. NBC_00670 TaxID=2975804 RepID=UPI002E36FCB7|nr:serine/threonine-protein kinase [Streptomyces sp. NBC_00670]